MNADGSSQKRLTKDGDPDGDPEKIAFTSNAVIQDMNAKDGSKKKTVASAGNFNLDWGVVASRAPRWRWRSW